MPAADRNGIGYMEVSRQYGRQILRKRIGRYALCGVLLLWAAGRAVAVPTRAASGKYRVEQTVQKPAAGEGLTITIRVVDLETNAPITGVQVAAWTANNTILMVTPDSAGRLFRVSVPAGASLTIQASASHYAPTNLPLTNVRSAQNVLVQLARLKPSVLAIKAFDTRIGQPLTSAVATVTSQQTGKSERFAVTNGQIDRAFNEADDVLIRVEAPGYKSASRRLPMELTTAGNRYEFDAVLEKLRFSVNIRAVDKATGQAIPGIQYRLTGPNGVPSLTLTPDEATNVALADIPGVGTYQITSIARGYDDFTQSWVVEKEQSDVLFRLKARPAPVALKEINVKPATPAHTVTAPNPTQPLSSATDVAANTAGPPAVRKPAKSTPAVGTPPVVVKAEPSDGSTKLVAAAARSLDSMATAPATGAPTPAFGSLEKGTTTRLNNIYFDQSSPVLRPESHAELDQLYDLLARNSSLRIEIRGHTDNQGDFDLNTKLSRDRCQAVIDYLVGKGIARDRLRGVGRGPIDAVAPNNNEENRRKNRRVEFVIL